jgi:enoyl-[acyl-carrier protein] reductase I
MEMADVLIGKRGLVVGIANEHSIAWGCAKALRAAGADVAVTWLNGKAEPHVSQLADEIDARLRFPLDVEVPGQDEAVFAALGAQWGRLDFVLHSIAFAPHDDLHGRVVDASQDGFARAMDVSCHSFLRLARLAEPLMQDGGCLLTMSYLGAAEVVSHYGLMGPVKAALESSVRYLAAELGPKGIRVNAISPGPLATRAASGIAHFDELLATAAARAPLRGPLNIADVGALCVFLVSDGARMMTGDTFYVDGGYHILA